MIEEQRHSNLVSWRLVIAFSLFVIVVVAVIWNFVGRAQHQIIEFQARELAEVVARQAASSRTVYTKHVVSKLSRDGFGADLNSEHRRGYVPLPAQFMKLLGEESRKSSAGLYQYRALSKWNLNKEQGLSDDFQRWAWGQLEQQDQKSLAKPSDWHSIQRVETVGGERTLRYLRPDLATSEACVSCHNRLERTPEIIARRLENGVQSGKQWQLNQLMGAIEVQIPLEKIEMIAQSQKRSTLSLILAVIVAGLCVIGLFVLVDVSRARSLAKQLSHQANHDSLTGLFNRTMFERHLDKLFTSAREEQSEHALLFMDLDQFKVVNDTCGHMAGDELLRQLATLLLRDFRANDVFACIGGDEFGVLLEHCSMTAASEIADRIRQDVRDFRFAWDKETFEIGVSIGLVAITAESESAAAVLSAADVACYLAKDEGRNRVYVHSLSDKELVQRKSEMEWVTRVNRAMEEGRLQLAVQSAVALHDELIPQHYHEVLLRMVDVDGKAVSTVTVVNAAERYNFMPTIDRWVVKTALACIAGGRLKADKNNVVAINLSMMSLSDDHFLAFIEQQLDQHPQVSPHHLCFEITETAAVRNLSKALGFIGALQKLGCRFALDDFGSGLSSFGYLKNLPVDFLKIDGAFVKDIADDPIDCAMVESIVHIARAMGVPTIAEWVEDDAVLKRVTSLEVDYAQGYGVSRPQLVEVEKI